MHLKTPNSRLEFRGKHVWFITYNPKPIPTSQFDWDFQVDGYDGAEDSRDTRCGTGASIEDCMNQIEEKENNE